VYVPYRTSKNAELVPFGVRNTPKARKKNTQVQFEQVRFVLEVLTADIVAHVAAEHDTFLSKHPKLLVTERLCRGSYVSHRQEVVELHHSLTIAQCCLRVGIRKVEKYFCELGLRARGKITHAKK